MKVFENAQWIWIHKEQNSDEYAEFFDGFSSPSKNASLRLSCDGDYTLWVNGLYAASGQYGDFEHYKIYDTVDLTPFLTEGENRIEILVWHFGRASQRYFPAPAGLIYEITDGENLLAVSNTETLARMSSVYQSGRKKCITGQLGFGFAYDATKEERGLPLTPAVAVKKNCTFFPRPNLKQDLEPLTCGKEIRREENRILYDLGKECVGLLEFALQTEESQNFIIAFGEHLAQDGWVPRLIGGRDFSVEYRAKDGANRYVNHMLRFGCRYLEISGEKPFEPEEIGIRNQVYPVKRVKADFESDLDRRIYELCVNTLEKCMMEHYVDCPWREQNLYAFDSRNQMLCGYKVFEGGNTEYVRSNLMLFAKDRREDQLLSICSPCGYNLTIPSFSLYFALSSAEYLRVTKDTEYAVLAAEKISRILDAFLKNRNKDLVMRFEGAHHWNFYDWSEFSNGTLGKTQEAEADAAVNCLLILALQAMKEICAAAQIPFPYEGIAEQLRIAAKKAFFREDTGLISMRSGVEEYTSLANSLAILAGVVTETEGKVICRKIAEGKTVPCSLSMRVFQYDAMLQTEKETYYPYILNEIRRDYQTMLDSGFDCAWETIKGHEDFDQAGSLCHGWSAVPVLYLPQINR